ncbi:MAG: sigma 54-interacting transcriptional regulator [Gemmataceae bacterium]
MSANRLALVADDQTLAASIQSALKKNLGFCPPIRSFQAVRDCLGRDTDGVMVLAAATSQDLEQAHRLVQEITILQYPVNSVLIQGENLGTDQPAFISLHQPAIHRFRWPLGSELLTTLIKERVGKGAGFLDDDHSEGISDIISRRLVSHTPSLLPLVERITLTATHDVTVLLTGETGTGKTFLARLMHDCSPRRGNPFMVVPCGAQPANLVESAFFGHTKGAFTGADRAKLGKFAAAGEGTILLDEIDTLGLEQQASLLRVIETGEYEPVGSNETNYCKARVIVASNWDLQEATIGGRFRPDLYYRLNGMAFHLPPLRERIQDIAPLVRGMAAKFNTKFRKDLFRISSEAMAALETFHWPGNIRQLENAVQQAVLVSTGPELLLQHLPQPIREYMPATNGESTPRGESLLHNREVLERNVIQRALANNANSRARAANALGISRVTLYKKMKKYGLMNAPLRASHV